MAKSTSSVSPVVAALIASRSTTKRGSTVERVGDNIVQFGTSATRFAGQLSVAVDAANFRDGAKKQQLASFRERQQYWDAIAAEHGLSPDDVAALITA